MPQVEVSGSRQTRGKTRAGLGAALGGALGALLGVVIDGAIWLWLLASALSGGELGDAGPIATVSGVGDSVSVTGGPGLLVLPLLLAVVAAVAGALLGRLSSPRGATGSSRA